MQRQNLIVSPEMLIYERSLYNQIKIFFQRIFSNDQFGFPKSFYFQHSLIAVTRQNEAHL